MVKLTAEEENFLKVYSRRRSLEWSAAMTRTTIEGFKETVKSIVNKLGYASPTDYLNRKVLNKISENVELVSYITELEDKIVEFKENLDKGTGSFVGHLISEPLTPDEIISRLKLDKKAWKLSSYWNKQHVSGKYWIISALVTRIKEEETSVDKFMEFLETYTPAPVKPIKPLINSTYSNPVCCLLNICDFHLDKLDVNNVSVETRIQQYKNVVDNLIRKTYSSHNVDEIVFLLGNDFFQSDSFNNTTTKGTPISVSMEWDKAYELGFDLMVDTISKLTGYCNKLHIYLIQGNHARTKEYYLAHAIETYFKQVNNIVFHRSTDNLKVHVYHENFLGFNHGNNINDKLPLSFATTFYKEWGSCKHREIILSDKHYNSEKLFKSQGEYSGVRMRILPSLSAVDQWHTDNLFTNAVQSGIALIYDRNKGKISEFEERV